MKKTLYLIDGSAYIYRSFHAIRNLSNSKGLPTNAIFGFTQILSKLLNEKNPEYIAIAFDMKGKSFRNDIYADYKANRPTMPDELSVQIPYIDKIVEGYNFPVLKKEKYEADDIIGTISKRAEREGFFVLIITGDKDFLQLLSENIHIFDPMKEKLISPETLKKETNLNPNQIIDMMALSGDTSDNVPGVKGIGAKTAIELINEYQTLDFLYQNIDKIKKAKQKENLIHDKDNAYLSKNLVTINTNMPLEFNTEDFKRKDPNKTMLYEIFKELEFKNLQKQFSLENTEKSKEYKLVNSKEAFENLCKELENQEFFVLDTETNSEDPMIANLVGISFCFEKDIAYYVPLHHKTNEKQIEMNFFLEKAKSILENKNIIGHNIKYDKMVLARFGINLKNIYFDSMVASYVLNPSKRAHNLDSIAMELFDYKMIAFKDLLKETNAKSFDEVPLDRASFYSACDSDMTFSSFKFFVEELEKTNLFRLFKDIEMPLINVLAKMEENGVQLNVEKLKSISKDFGNKLDNLEKEIYKEAGEEFNINSPRQIETILFEKLQMPTQKKTKGKTGYSTDTEVLSSLALLHNLPKLILEYRTFAKLKSTYTENLIDLINPNTKRLHTSYNQSITATGRLSSSNPNLQNIPIKIKEGKQIRECFIPEEGNVFFIADYSQIELRILAHYSNDQIFLDAFNNDEDIHLRTACEIFNAVPEMIDPEMRRQAKAVNFGIIYGMSPFGLSKELGISQKMAKNYIESYFAKYKGIKLFIDKTIEEAKKTLKTTTLLGRIRNIPEINSSNKNISNFNERTAINTPIQGSAADIIKLAMIKIHNVLIEKNLNSKMILSVHDELVFEVPNNEKDILKQLVMDIMQNIYPLKVPLKVNGNFGDNWADKL